MPRSNLCLHVLRQVGGVFMQVCDGRPLVPQLSCSGMRKPGRASNWAQCCCSTAEDTQVITDL